MEKLEEWSISFQVFKESKRNRAIKGKFFIIKTLKADNILKKHLDLSLKNRALK